MVAAEETSTGFDRRWVRDSVWDGIYPASELCGLEIWVWGPVCKKLRLWAHRSRHAPYLLLLSSHAVWGRLSHPDEHLGPPKIMLKWLGTVRNGLMVEMGKHSMQVWARHLLLHVQVGSTSPSKRQYVGMKWRLYAGRAQPQLVCASQNL